MYLYVWLHIAVCYQNAITRALSKEDAGLENTVMSKEDLRDTGQTFIHCHTKPSYVWCLPKSYNDEENPFQHASLAPNIQLPWNYTFKFIINSIREIDDMSQTISLSLYFQTHWFEPRLRINETAKAWTELQLGPSGEVTVSQQNLRYLWYPELEIYGIEKFRIFNVLKKQSGLRITKERIIIYEVSATVKISCKMDFDKYPLDNQTCLFQVGSYYGSEETIKCDSQWEYDDSKQKNMDHVVSFKDLPDAHRTISLTSGNYSVCGFSILLARKRTQALFQIYMPSFMFVLASWISFVIKPDVVPGRMSMLVVILLVQLNLFNNSKDKAPAANKGINAVDLYLFFSMFLVFAALMEYAFVLVLLRSMPSWILKKIRGINLENGLDSNSTNLNRSNLNMNQTHSSRDRTRMDQDSWTTENKCNQHGQDDVGESLIRTKQMICDRIDFISLCLAATVFIIFHVVYILKYF